MRQFAEDIRRFAQDERGATAIEYGLIASLVALAVIASMITFGNALGGMFNDVAVKSVDAMDGIP